jgi:predicted Zn finger-like uncharacterized protein
MIIQCSSCGSKYKYDESKLGGASRKKVKCPKCKVVFEVIKVGPEKESSKAGKKPSPQKQAATQATVLDDTSSHEGPRTIKVRRDSLLNRTSDGEIGQDLLKLPPDRKLSLAVIQGANIGEIFKITKPQVMIGRGDADIVIQDLEASRAHARIDVIGTSVVLRDLNSTNGTYVNEQKITAENLDNQSEFRIGSTIFMLIMTDVE